MAISECTYNLQLVDSAYEYLCHIEEAKRWMESVLKESLPPAVNLEENLRNGVYLAKLANFVAPEKVPLSRIYDIFQHRYRCAGLQFRHTDNINYWIEALKFISFPEVFIVETTDVYNKRNMPKVIYCIHALSFHLFGKGQGPAIQNLFGKIHFDGEDIKSVCRNIQENKINIPSFRKIGGLLAEQSVTNINTLQAELFKVNEAIKKGSETKLLEVLSSSLLGLYEIVPKNMKHYMVALKAAISNKADSVQSNYFKNSCELDVLDMLLSKDEIQGYIREVNFDCIWDEMVKLLNNKEREKLKEVMVSCFTQFKDYKKQFIDYYVDETFTMDVTNIKFNTSRDIIQGIIRNGNRNAKEWHRISDALAKVKEAIICHNKEKLVNALRIPTLKLSSQISDFAAPLYLEELKEDFEMFKRITYEDLKSSLLVLNDIAKVSSAVDCRDCNEMWSLLFSPNLPFMNVDSTLKTQYLKSLYAYRKNKLLKNMENPLLTFVDIQECIDSTNMQASRQCEVLISMAILNEGVRESDSRKLIKAVNEIFPNVISSCDMSLFCQLLKNRLEKKEMNSNEEALWLNDVVSVKKEVLAYKESATKVFKEFSKKIMPEKSEENVLKSVENVPKDSSKQMKGIEKNVNGNEIWLSVKLSEEVTAYFNPVKQIFKWSKPEYLKHSKLKCVAMNQFEAPCHEVLQEKNLDGFTVKSIIKLQSMIRGFLARRKLEKLKKAVVVIQRWWRRNRNVKNNSLGCQSSDYNVDFYINKVDKIIKIQAFWRGYRCRKMLSFHRNRPFSPEDPSFQMLKRLALSRQINYRDYSIDLKVQAVKSCVVNTIKLNQDLARRLEEMDMKIGLLVQNRMSVEAIVVENKKIQSSKVGVHDSKGIKSFSKEGKRLLDGYQQLFYLLQINPAYLTRLIVRLPSRLNHIIQSCVFSLFNYGSNSRDSYLLLRLFRSALHEEVQTKFIKPADAVTGNPLVLRLAMAFARQAEGHNPLRNILGFLIEKVLNDKVFFDTNPIDIYRRWVNQMETESGKPSNLPHTVSQKEALSHPEVICRLNHNIRILQSWVKCFLERLVTCVNQFPYALRFTAKLLRNELLLRFPETQEKDVLKVVGNLVYYQYINSAIVAPDAFHTVSLPPDKPMKVEQRRNLASIAKILHFAATKKGFGEESMYLMCLNPFIIECHKEMKRFCRHICAVDDLEGHFHVTKYSEASRIDKPRIYMSLQEIQECHKLMFEVRQEIAPDSMDPIHEILDELGDPPSLSALVGCGNSLEENYSAAGRMQVCLELSNKFQDSPEDPSDSEKLFIRTKELIMNRLHVLDGETMSIAVQNPEHIDIARNLAQLELAGLVSRKNDYQDMVKSILRDVAHEQECKRLQKQELNALTIAQRGLHEKRKFYEEQLCHYEKYLKTCLENLTTRAGRKANHKRDRSLKYSGTRLREKGILISLEGVPPGQLKNVQFEISATPYNGIYSVHGRFMGVEVEKIDIDIQELLKLQFEGFREMDLFGKALINVNLLLHLLNKKFHARI